MQLATGVGAGLILSATMLVSPSPAAAHVTRVVGRYTFLIVLIEEPYFQDNRAGFEFWVRDGDRAVDGLDRTLHAEAIGHGAVVKLSISPRIDRGFYDAPFYPGSGGPYSLHLTGSIEGMAIDQLFLVTFPAYPRAPTRSAAANRSTAQVDSDSAGGSMTVPIAGAIAGLVVLSGIAFVIVRSGGHRSSHRPDRSLWRGFWDSARRDMRSRSGRARSRPHAPVRAERQSRARAWVAPGSPQT